jgi:hypothetical protein
VAPPQVYRWLAAQPGDLIVAEYPMVNFDEAAYYSYPFWQRVHGKRLFNGAAPRNPDAYKLFLQVAGSPGQQSLQRLKSAGVRYVVVHGDMYADGPIPGPIKRYYPREQAEVQFGGGVAPVPPLPPVARFGADAVYDLAELR